MVFDKKKHLFLYSFEETKSEPVTLPLSFFFQQRWRLMEKGEVGEQMLPSW
jgi:hypothetical protein